jgi:hypothetical protein
MVYSTYPFEVLSGLRRQSRSLALRRVSEFKQLLAVVLARVEAAQRVRDVLETFLHIDLEL